MQATQENLERISRPGEGAPSQQPGDDGRTGPGESSSEVNGSDVNGAPSNGAAAVNGSPAGAPRPGVKVTAAAVAYAKKRLAKRGTPEAAIRLGVRGGGCSGFQYVIEFSDDSPRSRDTVSEFDGVRFYVDKKSLIYLTGSTLEYQNTMMFQGFKFLNPQEAASCGCGHSFIVK